MFIHLILMLIFRRLKSIIKLITDADIARLEPGQYLNDILIEYGLRLWHWQLEMTYPAKVDTIHIFNSFFYYQLRTFGPQESCNRVKTWTSNVDIFSKYFVIVPIHESFHWYLAVIHRPEFILPYHLESPTSPLLDGSELSPIQVELEPSGSNQQTIIYVLDSMGFQHPNIGTHLTNYLRCEANARKMCSNTLNPIVPKQSNAKDCGVYVLHFAERFVEYIYVRHLKDPILEYIEDTIDLPLVPLIKPGKKKAETRGFYHLQIARLLVPVTMLQTFDKDPKKFCQNYQERELEDGQISSTHLPAFFYDDLGDAASLDFRELFTGLLQGRLIVLTLVHIYLGADNAQKFRAYFMALRLGGSDCKKFRVKKTGKAYQKKITRVTFSMIAELVLQVRHSLSSCDDRRCEEGSVVKLDAYDAVMALANNPEYFNEDFLKNVEEFYAEIVGWMLPEEEKPRLQNDEDPHCGLSLISKLLALQKQAAEEERAEAEAAPGTDKGEDSSEDGSIEMVASSRCGSPPPPSSDAEAVDLFNDDEVPETEDETDPPLKNSSASSSHPSSSSKSSRSFSALGSSNVFAYKNASTSKPSSSSLRVAVPEKRAKLSQVEKDPLAESQRSIIPTKKGKAKITVANPIKQMITPPKKPFVPPIRLVKYA
ncbi:hypothetical protein D9757_013732 [Collybiopsis confluens]|uniref:Ubiquitin-like protease family profile domain-containing protein n=1 Tax=Collybiopsis confluens TaxID=2823264 RepID=A0A8H5D2H7_9AGAR|nr:hypothetical protein D9757_013732 [Collybiopsis confluens]